ncbi:hypothetical protein GF420_01305 [candidate division GN15 bacterium]|nr:hypothetical protein [candidate division GN15 bacterium]
MVQIKRIAFVMAALAAFMLVMTGCEREITGEVETINDISSQNCFGCHNGQMDAEQGEWQNSTHASGNNIDYTNRGGRDCTACHNQEGFISFINTGTLPAEPFSSVSAIGCFACHNPHETGDFSLRAVDAYTLPDGSSFDHESGNLCANCHHSRLDSRTIVDGVSVSRYWGPHHGPQGDMINGSNGFEFPGEGYSFPSSPHATQVREACIGCHMGNPQAHQGYDIGGHSFNMVDEGSGETLIGLCADGACHPGVEVYDFTADADYDNDGVVEGYQTEIAGMLDSLSTLLQNGGYFDGSNYPVSGTIADANIAGAMYNYKFVEEDQSHGIHNFRYARSLLEASIDYMSNLPGATANSSQVSLEDGPAVTPMISAH